MVRLGRRVLVVGVSPEGLCSLGSIEDAAEVAEVLEMARPRSTAGRSLFQRLFDKYLRRVDQQARAAQTQTQAENLAAEVSDLRQRVRDLRQEE